MAPSGSARKRVFVAGLTILAFLIVRTDGCVTAAEPERNGPWKLEALRQPPKVTILDQGKTLTSLYFAGEPYHGAPTRVFAYLVHPEKSDGKLPAMVLVHGGGGKAFK